MNANIYLRFATATFAIGFACLQLLAAEKPPAAPTEIAPDPAIQAKIDELVKEFPFPGTKGSWHKNAFEAVKKLRQAFPDRRAQLIPQLVLYESSAKKEWLMHAADFILLNIARADLHKSKIIVAIAPYLFIHDRSMRIRLFELMDSFCCNGRPKIDFGRILSIMKRNKGELPDGLVRYMFERSPGEALLGYMRRLINDRSERRNFLWAERKISNAIWKYQYGFLKPHETDPAAMKELENLSQHKEWWARMYVAEIMRKHKEFRQPEIIERLKQDKHPLVRETIAAFAEKAEPSGSNKK